MKAKVKELAKKVIKVFFEIKEEPKTNKRKIPFEDNPQVEYKGFFRWEDVMTLEQLLEQEQVTTIKQIWIYEG